MVVKRRAFKLRPKRRFTKRVPKKKNPLPVKKYIPKASPVELKYMDTEQTSVAIGTSGSTYLLNGNVQGTSHLTRVGNRVTIKKIELMFGLATQLGVNVKICLVIDKQPNGSALSLSALYNTIGGAYYPWATRNSVNSQRFVTIKNFHISMNQQITGANVNKFFKKYIKCNIPIQYNGGVAGTVADIQSNSIYLVVFADNTASMSFTSRLRFSDD